MNNKMFEPDGVAHICHRLLDVCFDLDMTSGETLAIVQEAIFWLSMRDAEVAGKLTDKTEGFNAELEAMYEKYQAAATKRIAEALEEYDEDDDDEEFEDEDEDEDDVDYEDDGDIEFLFDHGNSTRH
jgi:hypothetical protein